MKYALMILLVFAIISVAGYYPSRFGWGEDFTYSACHTVLYLNADSLSPILVRIPPGEYLHTLKFSGRTFQAYSSLWGWYEATCSVGGIEYSGFIQDRDLAYTYISLSDEGTDSLFVFRILGFNQKDNTFDGRASVIVDGEIIASLDHQPCWCSYSDARAFNYHILTWFEDSSGFTGVRNLISLKSYFPACGYPGRTDLLFWTDDGRLICSPRPPEESGEAYIFHNSVSVILPSDSTGIDEHIIFRIHGEAYDEETGLWEDFRNEIESYLWTGEGFEEKFLD